MICAWCSFRFKRRQGGKAQRFCHPSCKLAFYTAAQVLGSAQLYGLTKDGTIGARDALATIAWPDQSNPLQATHTLPEGAAE